MFPVQPWQWFCGSSALQTEGWALLLDRGALSHPPLSGNHWVLGIVHDLGEVADKACP